MLSLHGVVLTLGAPTDAPSGQASGPRVAQSDLMGPTLLASTVQAPPRSPPVRAVRLAGGVAAALFVAALGVGAWRFLGPRDRGSAAPEAMTVAPPSAAATATEPVVIAPAAVPSVEPSADAYPATSVPAAPRPSGVAPSVGYAAKPGTVTKSGPPGLLATPLAMDPGGIYYFDTPAGGPPEVLAWRLGPADAFLTPQPINVVNDAASTQLHALTSAGDGWVLWGEYDGTSWEIRQALPGVMSKGATTAKQMPTALGADGSYVFWVEGTTIWRNPRSNAPNVQFLPSSTGILELAVEPYADSTSSSVYWFVDKGSGMADLCSSAKTATPAACTSPHAHGLQNPRSLALGGTMTLVATYAYWTESTKPDDCTVDGQVRRVALGTPTKLPETIVTAKCPKVALDVPNNQLYWSTGAEIHRMPIP